MRLTLARRWLTPASTIGELSIDSVFACFVLEDRYRPPHEKKVYGQTAIPSGLYRVAITQSPRFGRQLPLVCDVPGFEGVRIHSGNSAGDTEGCLLPGRKRFPDRVEESRLAFEALYMRLVDAESRREAISLEIVVVPS